MSDINNNGFAVRGTMRLLQRGDITLEQTEETVNMWIEITAKKFYNEGLLDGLKRNNPLLKKSHQALCDMVPESDENGVLSLVTGNGVVIQRNDIKEG